MPRKMPLKVYSWTGHRRECPNLHRQTTEIVAATSQKAAAATVGETPGRLFNLREVMPSNEFQTEKYNKALSEPGVVFWRPLDTGRAGGEWTRVEPKVKP